MKTTASVAASAISRLAGCAAHQRPHPLEGDERDRVGADPARQAQDLAHGPARQREEGRERDDADDRESTTVERRCWTSGKALRPRAPAGRRHVEDPATGRSAGSARAPRGRPPARGRRAAVTASLEAQLGGLLEAGLELADGADLAGQADFAEEDRGRGCGQLERRGDEGGRGREVGRRLADPQAAGDVQIDVAGAESQARSGSRARPAAWPAGPRSQPTTARRGVP